MAGKEPLPAEPSRAAAGAILTIDLGAVRFNYRLLARMLGGARCGAVVKADGYGLGAAPIAQALIHEGCDTFFVAHLSEGLALRAALGPDIVIYVLNGLPPGTERTFVDAGLRPVLNSAEQIRAWDDLGRPSLRPQPAAIQVDTGMARLGLPPEDVVRFTEDARILAGIQLTLVMSHLACADVPDHPANAQQLKRFQGLRPWFAGPDFSLANSSGIFLGTDWHFDLARPGAALYGINPTPHLPNPMQPVVRLEARVIQTRSVKAGAGIGYGHALVAEAPVRLATIALGYADGWPRRLNGAAFFKGTALPFVGRVSMDSIILDVSALPEGAIAPGDLVELIGPHRTVDEVAADAGTIGYEILTGLGNRFHRVYTGGDA
ncbi:MAG: alanine racemase [Rhizobiaceae bacterium]|nr:alanine racemase [Rhizobiaceae bacterium]